MLFGLSYNSELHLRPLGYCAPSLIKEKLSYLFQVGNWDGDYREPRHVVINTEWGAFGDQGELDFILTK